MSGSIQLFPVGFFAVRSEFRDRQPTVLLPDKENEQMCLMLSDPDLAEIRTTWIAPAGSKAFHPIRQSPDAVIWISRIGN